MVTYFLLKTFEFRCLRALQTDHPDCLQSLAIITDFAGQSQLLEVMKTATAAITKPSTTANRADLSTEISLPDCAKSDE